MIMAKRIGMLLILIPWLAWGYVSTLAVEIVHAHRTARREWRVAAYAFVRTWSSLK